MALFDFMNRPISGNMTAPESVDADVSGGSTVNVQRQPIGPTYGNLVQAAMMYGSRPGSSAPLIASLMGNRQWNRGALNPLTPPGAAQPPQDDDILDQVGRFFVGLLGGR